MPESEQPKGTSTESKDTGLKSLEDFGKLPLDQMEKELTTKDYTKANPLNLDHDQQDSETSEETSTDETTEEAPASDEEQVSDDDNDSNESESTESEDSQSKADKQKKEKKLSDSERLTALEKSNKELQAEFTRRSQRLKDLEKENAELKANKPEKAPEKTSEQDDPELARLKEKDPKAYDALNRLIDKIVDKRVTEKVKPVEEQVTLRKRQDNATKFNKSVDEFLASPLKELEADMVAIINENPSEWQRTIWENDNAFENLKKELIYRHTTKVAKLLTQAEKTANADSTKKERLKEGQVGTKTKVSQPTRDVMSDSEFRKLPLAEMEKRLPKVRN